MGGADAMLTRDGLADCARLYLAGRAPEDPDCSPLFADLSGLPPILIQVGTREILLSDAERLAQRAREAGVDVRLQRFDGLGHAFQLHAGTLRASDEAISEVAVFLDERW
jgi:epsilon-lactone hydrolase